MSCSFWNMRRRLRKQLNEKAQEEEKVTTDIATAQNKLSRHESLQQKGGE